MLNKIILILWIFLVCIACSPQNNIKPEITAINTLLNNSSYSFNAKKNCQCTIKGPSIYDFVGDTEWKFNLKDVIEVKDTFLTHQVRLKLKNHHLVKTKVYKWLVDMSTQDKVERSTYDFVPITIYNEKKANDLVKEIRIIAKKCGAKLK